MKRISRSVLAMFAGTLFTAPALAQSADEVINQAFYPYKAGVPTVPGVDVGVVIDKNNADQFKAVLDPVTYELLKEGVHPSIEVGPTDSFEVHPKYVEATRQNIGKVKIVGGNLEGYSAGRPFPELPSSSDADAGRKLAFNFRHTFSAGDNVQIKPFYWKYRNAATGKVDRTVEFQFNFLNFKHRVAEEPIPAVSPNPNDYFRGIYGKAFSPQDVQDTQLMILAFDQDQKASDGYLYLGFQRRVRRLETSQTTDAFLGSDLMIQDFEGYFGRVAEMNWNFKGTKTLLMPLYRHNEQKLSDEYEQPDGYKFVAMTGQGECFPNVTWQLRQVHELEMTPVDKSSPVGRRVMYLDSQTFVAPRTLIYDRADKLWKSWTIGHTSTEHHLPSNKGKFAAIYDSFGMFDVQNQRCTTGQFRTEIDASKSPVRMFTPQFMRSGGA
ncbi:DUF1329 domain-containing protein [Sinimarinibacterium flocculans]|uniref:Uncharacterized protein DUF1329 n=1 Tax=Sinimarinibacterium flocculans TaxID=985250 RepID=A0A318E4N2_9GAMM|nr:DUF1329 domain-containing protein [Sinimarinibacterium flocculans]PXV63449.1 uncharacterized protein DUF1329 [Sinimarinibacterium flocculans]